MIKKIAILLLIFLTILLVVISFENKESERYEPKEYEVLSIRRYAEITEKGVFVVKKDYEWVIEAVYKTEDGMEIYNEKELWVQFELGEENKIVFNSGIKLPTLFVTLEKYNELYGLE